MKKYNIIILIFSLCQMRYNYAQTVPNEVRQAMDLSICAKYDQAISLLDSIQPSYPQNPMIPFFHAAILQSRMMDFETACWSQEFYQFLEQAIAYARQSLQTNPDDPHAIFFLGAALSYKSFQLAREKKYLAAFQIAIKSIRELQKVSKLDSTFCDTHLAIGSYEYWRSRITRNFNWLPFFADKRAEGIAKIQRAYRCGQFTRWAALSNLTWIHIEEQNYDAAIDCAEQGLENFPGSRFFLWPLGEAQFKKGEYPQAIQTFQTILSSVRSEQFNNHYNEILLLYKLAQCYLAIEEIALAHDLCLQALAIPASGECEKKINQKKKMVIQVLKEINGHVR